jgi:hypothetical protein
MKKTLLSLLLLSIPFSVLAQRKAREMPYTAPQAIKFFKNHPTGYGMVLMSFSISRDEPQDGYFYELFWRREAEQAEKRLFYPIHKFVQGYNNSYGPNVVNDSMITFYRLLIMPVGKHSLYNFGLNDGLMEIVPKETFDMPFEVSENRINYIGDFLFLKSMHKTIFGKIMNGGVVFASNRMGIDSSYLVSPKSKFNSLDFSQLTIIPPHILNADTSQESSFLIKN